MTDSLHSISDEMIAAGAEALVNAVRKDHGLASMPFKNLPVSDQRTWIEKSEACLKAAAFSAHTNEPLFDNGEFPSVYAAPKSNRETVPKRLKCAPSQQPSPAYEWQPIETAPKDGKWALLFSPDSIEPRCFVGQWRDDNENPWGGAWWPDHETSWPIDAAATHWMPLPEPPSALLNKDGG